MPTQNLGKEKEKTREERLLDNYEKTYGLEAAIQKEKSLKEETKQIKEFHASGRTSSDFDKALLGQLLQTQPQNNLIEQLLNSNMPSTGIQAQGESQPQPEQQSNQSVQFLPAKGLMSPAQQLPSGQIQEGGALSWIGGHSTNDLLKKMLILSKIQGNEGMGGLDPEQAALKISEANEALAAQGLEGYEAKLTAQGGITASKPSSYTTATSKENIESTVEGIANGELPPDLTKVVARRDLTNVSGKIVRKLANKGLDFRQLALDYQAEQGFVKSINSTQQLRLRQLIPSVINGIDDLQKLNQEFKRTGIKGFNRATIEYYANGGGTKEQQQLAQKFVTQMTVLSDEMGSIFMGGNTPTERSLDLAMKLFNSDYNDTAVDASMVQVRRNLGYRANAIESVQAVGTKGLVKKGGIEKQEKDVSEMSDEELQSIISGGK